MSNNRRNGAMAIVFATMVGYVAGVLTAPKSGQETRQDIKDNAKRVKGQAEDKLRYMRSELSDLITTGKRKALDVKESTKTGFKDALTRAERAKDQASEILSALREGDADDEDLQKATHEVKKAIEHLKQYVEKTSTNE